MIKVTAFSAALALAIWSTPASAGFTLKDYQELRELEGSKQTVADYLSGLGNGIFWANVATEVRTGTKLFCMPDKLAISHGLTESLLDQEILKPVGDKPYKDDTPIELILVKSFVARFPCN